MNESIVIAELKVKIKVMKYIIDIVHEILMILNVS